MTNESTGTKPESTLGREFWLRVRDRFAAGDKIAQIDATGSDVWSIVFGEGRGLDPLRAESRAVVVADLVGFSQKPDIHQALLGALLSVLLDQASEWTHSTDSQSRGPSVQKALGDGALYGFGAIDDPISIRDAIRFAANVAAAVSKYNKECGQSELGVVQLGLGLSYGRTFPSVDLLGENDLLGPAANTAARLACARGRWAGSVLMCQQTYHYTQIARSLYFTEDGKPPGYGEFSGWAIGRKPDANNFLYIAGDGLVEVKSQNIWAHCLRGRLGGYDF